MDMEAFRKMAKYTLVTMSDMFVDVREDVVDIVTTAVDKHVEELDKCTKVQLMNMLACVSETLCDETTPCIFRSVSSPAVSYAALVTSTSLRVTCPLSRPGHQRADGRQVRGSLSLHMWSVLRLSSHARGELAVALTDPRLALPQHSLHTALSQSTSFRANRSTR